MPNSNPLQEYLSEVEMEASLLSAFAEDPDLLWQWGDHLPERVFSDEANQEVYRAQQEAAALTHSLPAPAGNIAPASDPNKVAEHLQDLYQRRQLAELCQKVLQKVREAEDGKELLAALVADVADLETEQGALLAAPLTPADDLLSRLWIDLEARATASEGTGLPGIPTQFRHLDNLTNGLEPGLYLLAGPPKAGKTTFANQIAYQVAASGVPVVYVSFENDVLDLLLKQVCRLSGQTLLKAQKGQANLVALQQGAERLKREVPGRLFYLLGNAETTPSKVRAKAKQALARQGATRCLVVIDYLQKMALVKPGVREMRDCVNRLSLELRDLARELDSPLLAVASLSREGYAQGRKPSIAALKESGNLEYDADSVWLLDPGEEMRGDLRKVDLTVAAARRSPTGTVELMLKQSSGNFTEVENER